MRNDELREQFARCQEWRDTEQWGFLALAYYQRGYWFNALYCFKQADACRVVVETVAG